MSDEFEDTLTNRVSEAIEFCVDELGLRLPLHIVVIDMGARLIALTIHEDGKSVLISDPGPRVSELLYPIHVLVVDRDGESITLTAKLKNKPMRTLH